MCKQIISVTALLGCFVFYVSFIIVYVRKSTSPAYAAVALVYVF